MEKDTDTNFHFVDTRPEIEISEMDVLGKCYFIKRHMEKFANKLNNGLRHTHDY